MLQTAGQCLLMMTIDLGGAVSLKREIGVYPISDIEQTDSKSFVRRALYIVFAAVTASCILLETFELCAGFLREIVGPDMLKLPELCSN